MQVTALADEYGVSEDVIRDACRQLGLVISVDDDVDEQALRAGVDARRAANASTTAAVANGAPSEPEPAEPSIPEPEQVAVEDTIAVRRQDDTPVALAYPRATPALFAGLALVAAFFMPLASGFGGLLSVSSFGYLRLVREFHNSLSFGDWVAVAALAAGALLGIAVVVTEALGARNRLVLVAAAIVPIGLIGYVLVRGASVNDLGHAEIAGYLAVAAAIVLLFTASDLLDRGSPTLRAGVFAVCGLLLLAGIAVPAVTNSLQSDLTDAFRGFTSDL
ncbi:MAG: hypothetical protein H0U92_13425 [Actinobacteria bacterium]|nr:hypothetical protein [Actinomycetota bacterium]